MFLCYDGKHSEISCNFVRFYINNKHNEIYFKFSWI